MRESRRQECVRKTIYRERKRGREIEILRGREREGEGRETE